MKLRVVSSVVARETVTYIAEETKEQSAEM